MQAAKEENMYPLPSRLPETRVWATSTLLDTDGGESLLFCGEIETYIFYDPNGNRVSFSDYRSGTAVVNNGVYDDQDRMTSYGNATDGYADYTSQWRTLSSAMDLSAAGTRNRACRFLFVYHFFLIVKSI